MAPVFPTIYSTLSPDALAKLVTERYGLTGVQAWLLVRGVGDTYRLLSPVSRYILRVYRSSHRSLPQVKAEVELLLALQKAGVSVSYPIADGSGETIQILEAAEGKRYAVLFSYAPGEVVSLLSEEQLRSLGQQVGRCHAVSATLELSDRRWSYTLDTMLFGPLEQVRSAFSEIPEEYDWWQRASRQVEKKLGQPGVEGFAKGYCHFDLLPKNFHFDGSAVTLFDFDFFGYGWLVNDIMTFWVHLSLDVHFGRLTQEGADKAYAIFLDAYREVRPLSPAELAAVPYLSLGFWGYYMGFHATHDQFYSFVQPSQLKMRTALIRQLMERYWEKEDY